MSTQADAQTLNQQGLSAVAAGDLQAARQAFEKALLADSSCTELYNNLAEVLCRCGDAQHAAAQLLKALSLNPFDRSTVLNLGDLCTTLGQWDAAERAYRNFLSQNPTDAEVLTRLNALLEARIQRLSQQQLSREAVEEGLIKALELLEPRVKVVIGSLYYWVIGNLTATNEIFLRRRQLFGADPNTVHLFLCGEPANRQLLKMYQRHMNIIENKQLLDFIQSCEKFKQTRFYQPVLSNLSNEYYEFRHGKPSLYFTEEEEAEGQRQLRAMGVETGAWFVTVFARDANYKEKCYPGMGYNRPSFYRNCDIATYHKAIDYILERGGYVLRMGSAVKDPLLHSDPRVIDYATKHRNDFMDIFLIAKSRFMLSSPSGILELCYAFNVPVLYTNQTPVGTPPYGPNALYISKRVRQRETGAYANYRALVQEFKNDENPAYYDGAEFWKLGYSYEDNSADEILEATKEMFERLEGSFRTEPEDEFLQKELVDLLPPGHLAYQHYTPMARTFLRENQEYFFGKRLC